MSINYTTKAYFNFLGCISASGESKYSIYVFHFCVLGSIGALSPQALASIQKQIDREKAELLATKDLAEGEKKKAELALQKREKELRAAQEQHSNLEKKLMQLTSQVSHSPTYWYHVISALIYVVSLLLLSLN